MASNLLLLEKINERQLMRFDALSVRERVLIQQMIMLVKNGHTHKFTYRLNHNKVHCLIKKIAQHDSSTDYGFRALVADLRSLNNKTVQFTDRDGYIREFSWLTDLTVDYDDRQVSYHFCKDLSRTCLWYEGMVFILQLIDFVALESMESGRMFRFLSHFKNKKSTTHRVSALLKYFFVQQKLTSLQFLDTIIRPALQEISRISLFTFAGMSARLVNINDEDYIQIDFATTVDKYLPHGYKNRH